MSRQFLIIDGYNLLPCTPFGRRRYGPGRFPQCRQQMVDELNRRLDPQIAAQAVIVFDGQAAPDPSSGPEMPDPGGSQRMRVIYSTAGREADAVIEDLLRQHPAPRQVIVVSSDRRLQTAAARRGARSVNSADFWSAIEAETGDQDSRISRASSGGPRLNLPGQSGSGHNPEVDLNGVIEREFLAVDPASLRSEMHGSANRDQGHRGQ